MGVLGSIPASQLADVIPSVIGAGGAALDLSGMVLTQNPRVAVGAVPSFPSAAAVAAYFGAASQEASMADIYFLGFTGCTAQPGAMWFAQYSEGPVGAWLRGGSLAGMTLAQLQALSGSLTVTVNGVVETAAAINLAGVTSFSAAAALIATDLALAPIAAASFTGSIAAEVLTVTAMASGTLAVNQTVAGGATPAGMTITGQLTSTAAGGALGGVGTYSTSEAGAVASGPLTTTTPAVVYDSVSGAFVISSGATGALSTIGFASGTLAASLLLTAATGAVTSQGALASTPAGAMNAVLAVTENWATFTTTWPVSNAEALAFAAWNNAQDDAFAYVMWTENAAPTTGPDTTSPYAAILAANYSGVIPIYETDSLASKAAFALGYAASVDFAATNGRATMAFRAQTGLVPDVVSGTVASNLTANNYNFYGGWSTANQQFLGFGNGFISGPYQWVDSYLNQIWLTNQLQLAMITLLFAMKSIPYNAAGYSIIRAACLDPITAAINFGAIRKNVTLSAAQIAEVNFAAGLIIDPVLSSAGYYLQVLDPTPQVRAARGTPVINLWYMDGGSVQQLSLASVLIQ